MTVHLGAAAGRLTHPSSRRPQRVLMTVDAMGGVWRYALDLSRSLGERGVRVALIGFGPPPSKAQRTEARTAGIPLTWEVLPLEWMPGGIDKLEEARRAIAREARAFRADLLHVNSLAFACASMAPLPIVAVAHSCVPTWWRAVRGDPMPQDWRAHAHANRAGLRTASLVITPSHSHARDIGAVYGPHPNVRVVYNASSDAPPVRRRREPIVFAAGRWWDEAKNARVLDAAASMTSWPVAMAGSLHDPAGPRQKIVHARALGPLDATTTGEWMRRASVFAAPSIYEPFGLAVLEAARASTPLVLADIPTFRELWDGAALFAKPDSPPAFAHAINTLIQDTTLRRTLARRARTRAGRFTRSRQSDLMLCAYAEALSVEAPPEQLRSVV